MAGALVGLVVVVLSIPLGAAGAKEHRGDHDPSPSPVPPSVSPSVSPSGAPLVIVFMENKSPNSITASTAPYLAGLGSQGLHFTNYGDISHPSLPNYLAFASGSMQGKAGTDLVQAGEITGPNLWDQLTSAGVSWAVYQELMPTACFAGLSNMTTTGPKDKYAIRHDPAIVFNSVLNSAECQNVLPLTNMVPSQLPDVSFVTPSICNDMHGVRDSSFPADCQGGTDALVTRGDTWLGGHVPAWLAAGATVIITFDEGSKVGAFSDLVDTVEVGNSIPPAVDATSYNHYSLLAGIEDRYALGRLGNAAAAAPLPIG